MQKQYPHADSSSIDRVAQGATPGTPVPIFGTFARRCGSMVLHIGVAHRSAIASAVPPYVQQTGLDAALALRDARLDGHDTDILALQAPLRHHQT